MSGMPYGATNWPRITLALGSLLLAVACGGHPTDQHLIDRFNQNREAFATLRDMFVSDRTLGRVAPDFTRPVNFFSGGPIPHGPVVTSQRLADYRALFRQLDLSAGIEGYDTKREIFFHASALGLGISGSSKGYAYCRDKPDLIVSNLDTYRSQGGRSFTAFRPIEGQWYLYFDFED